MNNMLYHIIKALLVFVFISVQTISVAHALEHAEDHHHECVMCDVGITSQDTVCITPSFDVELPILILEPVVHDSIFISAIPIARPGRSPPPRGPPNPQV